jgi:predicted tellurium resistance membrane protein TerC
MVEILQNAANFLVLILLEVVLGIDNIIFLAILTERLPIRSQKTVRTWGLAGALVFRIALLASALVIVKLSEPIIHFDHLYISPHDLFFIIGGVFLVYKSLKEIAVDLEFYESSKEIGQQKSRNNTVESKFFLLGIIIEVIVMDLIFSLDSVLTAVGLSKSFYVMSFAILFAIGVMFFLSDPITKFIHKHPSIKMLALAFLVMLGFILCFDGFHYFISRGYLYFAMFFSLSVEGLNLLYKFRKKT